MFLKKLWIEQYRNINNAYLEPGRNLTIFHGLNGQGKTNLLESIYLLGNARPFRSARIFELIFFGSKKSIVRGNVQSALVESEIVLQLEQSSRRVCIDGKTVHRAPDLHGKLAVVVFSPDDTAMVKLGPETRRRYLDRSLYVSNTCFLQDYHTYYRTLKHRNTLLKSSQHAGLDLWTEQLAIAGVRLMEHRKKYVTKLNLLLQKYYQQIAGEHEQVAVSYDPDIILGSENEEATLVKLLQIQQEQDLRYKTTGRGPHRDDLIFLIKDRPLKHFGSQGQQRSFVLALKMAELDHLKETFGEMPVLLLDDIASELDRQRMTNLLVFLREQQVQVLITTTDITPFIPVLQEDSKLFRVEAGRLTYEGNGTP
jgi:DNA replication and repair protein RecF